jgi:chromosome segregation ATPase
MLEGTFQSFQESQHLAQDLEAKIQELDRVTSAAERTIDEISILRQEFNMELDSERQGEIRTQINSLQMRNFRLQQELAETETQVSDAEVAVEESIEDLQSRLRENYTLLESAQSELRERRSSELHSENRIDTLFESGRLDDYIYMVEDYDILMYTFQKYPEIFTT